MSEETQAARLQFNIAASQRQGTLMTQRKFTALMIVGLLAVAVTEAAWSGRDREWVDEDCTGECVLVEDTFDWYAQDDDGNVWYPGEDTTAWDDEANCLTDAGSWKAGDDGAVPGVLMLSHPRPGVSYQQEYYEGQAEDWAQVLRLDARVSIDLGDYHCAGNSWGLILDSAEFRLTLQTPAPVGVFMF